MPKFDGVLDDQQILDVIAWFQSKWPNKIYASWQERELKSRQAQQ